MQGNSNLKPSPPIRRILNLAAIALGVAAIGWYGFDVAGRLARSAHQNSVAPKLSVIDPELAAQVLSSVASINYNDEVWVRHEDVRRSVDALGSHQVIAEDLASGRFDVAFSELEKLAAHQTGEFGIKWRMIGALAVEVRPEIAIRAYELSLRSGDSNAWDRIYRSRLALYEERDVIRAKMLIAEGRLMSEDQNSVIASTLTQGDIAFLDSDYSDALAFYLEGVTAAEQARRQKPGALERINMVQLLHFKAADAARLIQDFDLAEQHYLHSIAFLRDLARKQPENYGTRSNIGVVQSRLGQLELVKGDRVAAKAHLLQALETQKPLVSKYPNDTKMKVNLLGTYDLLTTITGDIDLLQDAVPVAKMVLSEPQVSSSDLQRAKIILERTNSN